MTANWLVLVIVTAMRMVMMPMIMMIVTVMRVMVRMTMPMTMRMVVPMVVPMAMRRAGLRIGAAFRIERRIDQGHPGAERAEQRLDGRLAPRPDAVRQHLHRHMTVAEMPGEPRQRRHIGGARLDQRLRRRHHFDQTAVVENQQIVGAQPHRRIPVDLQLAAFDGFDCQSPGTALGVVEDHGIARLAIVALGGSDDACGAGHGGQFSRDGRSGLAASSGDKGSTPAPGSPAPAPAGVAPSVTVASVASAASASLR